MPWWVELLFVQIGLPDSWLRSFLKNRKKIRLFINDNKSPLGKVTLLAFVLVYIFPLIQRARIHNLCIKNSQEILKLDKPNISKNNLQAISTNYCNGGDK